jgi:hypothetical protein
LALEQAMAPAAMDAARLPSRTNRGDIEAVVGETRAGSIEGRRR